MSALRPGTAVGDHAVYAGRICLGLAMPIPWKTATSISGNFLIAEKIGSCSGAEAVSFPVCNFPTGTIYRRVLRR